MATPLWRGVIPIGMSLRVKIHTAIYCAWIGFVRFEEMARMQIWASKKPNTAQLLHNSVGIT
jgi:hypothetical protein